MMIKSKQLSSKTYLGNTLWSIRLHSGKLDADDRASFAAMKSNTLLVHLIKRSEKSINFQFLGETHLKRRAFVIFQNNWCIGLLLGIGNWRFLPFWNKKHVFSAQRYESWLSPFSHQDHSTSLTNKTIDSWLDAASSKDRRRQLTISSVIMVILEAIVSLLLFCECKPWDHAWFNYISTWC